MGKNEVAVDKAELASLKESVQNLTAENERLRQKLEHMNELLLNAQRARFGQSSEKKAYVMPGEQQLRLFDEAETEQAHKAPEPTEETITVAAHKRKPKRTMDELTADLPVEEILIELPKENLICDKCGGTFVMIGKKFVNQEIQAIPAGASW